MGPIWATVHMACALELIGYANASICRLSKIYQRKNILVKNIEASS